MSAEEHLEPYLIKSKNTEFYIVSAKEDKPGQQVDTKNGKTSIPPLAVRFQISSSGEA